MANAFLTRDGYWREVQASDLPALPSLNGLLDIHQIAPTGYTGQIIQDIGTNTMGWRYPHHIGGEGGYILLPAPYCDGSVTLAQSADKVYCFRFQLGFTISVSSIAFSIATADAGNFASVGIYDSNGTRFCHTGAKSTAATGIVSTAMGSPFPLMPGSYWWCWTTDSNTMAFNSVAEYPETIALLNSAVAHYGLATNASVAGELPETLGGVSADSGFIAIGILQG